MNKSVYLLTLVLACAQVVKAIESLRNMMHDDNIAEGVIMHFFDPCKVFCLLLLFLVG